MDQIWKENPSRKIGNYKLVRLININPFQPNVAFHVKTSDLLCCAKQMTGFYLKCKVWLELV